MKIFKKITASKITAFSLLEIILVISIIGLLTTAHITVYQRFSKELQKKQEELMIVNALNNYVRHYGDFKVYVNPDNMLVSYQAQKRLKNNKVITQMYQNTIDINALTLNKGEYAFHYSNDVFISLRDKSSVRYNHYTRRFSLIRH